MIFKRELLEELIAGQDEIAIYVGGKGDIIIYSYKKVATLLSKIPPESDAFAKAEPER